MLLIFQQAQIKYLESSFIINLFDYSANRFFYPLLNQSPNIYFSIRFVSNTTTFPILTLMTILSTLIVALQSHLLIRLLFYTDFATSSRFLIYQQSAHPCFYSASLIPKSYFPNFYSYTLIIPTLFFYPFHPTPSTY